MTKIVGNLYCIFDNCLIYLKTNLTEGAIMKKIKLIPFYLLLALNGFFYWP